MPYPMISLPSIVPRALVAALLLGAALTAQGEKADRSKPMVVEADKPGSVDL